MSRKRVLVLVRDGLVPPDSLDGYEAKEIAEWKCEFDVVQALRKLDYDVQPLGVYDDLGPLRQAIAENPPDIAFMLLEEFHGVTAYDQAVVSYLELMRQLYTGCNPLGMMLSRNKALAKKILLYHRIPTPHFVVAPQGRKLAGISKLKYPLLVKAVQEDASQSIAQASVVRDREALEERIKFVHESVNGDALIEEYIEGRELYVGVIGNERLQTYPIWEMDFGDMPADDERIATRRIKWNEAYREKYSIDTRAARNLPDSIAQKVSKLCKRVYRELSMSGYARIDLRLTEDGRAYVLEANANPNLAKDEDFAASAKAAGVDYESLLQKIIQLGLQYPAAWKG